jgi:hypothetical protein
VAAARGGSRHSRSGLQPAERRAGDGWGESLGLRRL